MKYLEAYQAQYPGTKILLVSSDGGDMLYTPYAKQRDRLRPAIELLKSTKASNALTVLHIFSNRGSNSAVQLADAWRASENSTLPVHSMIFDRCPGSASYKLAAEAVVLSFPPNAYLMAFLLAWLVVMPMYIFLSLFGRSQLIAALRHSLNDPRLFPTSAWRTYLYSSADRMVPPQDVERHCAEARVGEYDAGLVDFGDSAHVSHMRKDSERYWKAIRYVLDRGSSEDV